MIKRSILVAAVTILGIAAPVAAETQTGMASWYGPGTGVASQWCTWTLRTTQGCGWARITSQQTGITVVAPVIDWCQCYRDTPQERIIDLQWGVVEALGLDINQGIYPVTVEWNVPPEPIPDTAVHESQALPLILFGVGLTILLIGLHELIDVIRWEWARHKLMQSDRFKDLNKPK